MWKIVLVLLATAAAMFMARLAYDPPPLDKKLGAASGVETAYVYAGVRG
jgi:hypothetical protein